MESLCPETQNWCHSLLCPWLYLAPTIPLRPLAGWDFHVFVAAVSQQTGCREQGTQKQRLEHVTGDLCLCVCEG